MLQALYDAPQIRVGTGRSNQQQCWHSCSVVDMKRHRAGTAHLSLHPQRYEPWVVLGDVEATWQEQGVEEVAD